MLIIQGGGGEGGMVASNGHATLPGKKRQVLLKYFIWESEIFDEAEDIFKRSAAVTDKT